MDNNNSIRFEHTPYHNVYLKDRKNIELTGVKNIESFDSLEFLIETSLGFLNITGTELSLTRLDQEKCEVSIKGNIDAISYVSNKIKKEKTVFLINCLNNGLSKTNSRN